MLRSTYLLVSGRKIHPSLRVSLSIQLRYHTVTNSCTTSAALAPSYRTAYSLRLNKRAMNDQLALTAGRKADLMSSAHKEHITL